MWCKLKRGFYESYRHDRERQERPIIVRNAGFGTAVIEFFRSLITAVLYLAAVVLSSVGLTTLANKPLRDMLIDLVIKTFFGS